MKVSEEEKELLISALQSHIHGLKCKKGIMFVDANFMSRDEKVAQGAVTTIKLYESVCNDIKKCEKLIEWLKE